jgi:Na+/proline symporter
MDSVTRQILLIASGLGLGSYCLCLYYRRSTATVGLEDFLLTGNRPVAAAVSIVGTIFSGSILFTGMVHFYRVFGWFLLPFYLASAVLGLGFLTTRVRTLGAGHTQSAAISPRGTLQRYQRLSRETGNRVCHYLVCLMYVVATLTTELSVFRGGLEAFGEDLAVPGATFVLVAITYAYVYLGGFRGVLLTDIIQMVTILVAFGILIATLVIDARQHGQSFR